MEQFKRYEKQVPGHQNQVDVKFLFFQDIGEKEVRRFRYTAIEDATRASALNIYPGLNQKCAIQFVNYFVKKFPFRIHTV